MSFDEQWLGELVNLNEKTVECDGFLTAEEMASRLGRNVKNVRDLLRKAKDLGILQSRQKLVEAINGRTMKVTAYKVVRNATPETEKTAETPAKVVRVDKGSVRTKAGPVGTD